MRSASTFTRSAHVSDLYVKMEANIEDTPEAAVSLEDAAHPKHTDGATGGGEKSLKAWETIKGLRDIWKLLKGHVCEDESEKISTAAKLNYCFPPVEMEPSLDRSDKWVTTREKLEQQQNSNTYINKLHVINASSFLI